MFDLCKFLAFLLLVTAVFFLPNTPLILLLCFLNLLALPHLKKVLLGTLKFLPFIFLTFLFNIWLDTFDHACWVSLKLLLVCNLTMIYAARTTVLTLATTLEHLCAPLRLFHIDPADVKLLVCLSLSLIPVLKRDLRETRAACAAKGLKLNFKNAPFILSRFFLVSASRINELEASLLAKGYPNDPT